MSQPTPATTKPEVFTYHTAEQLTALSLKEAEALWELVPTERQRLYKAKFDRYLRDKGALGADDRTELAHLEALLRLYAEKYIVPVDAYWVPVPKQVREAASASVELAHSGEDAAPRRASRPLPLLVGGGVIIVILLFLMLRGGSRPSSAGTKTLTPTPSATATLVRSPTPTPLALEAQDAIIRGGDVAASSSGGAFYPVNLRVDIAGQKLPRVFVVQRRRVETAEWNYENNPDTASQISGLVVRPVLGIPFSEENLKLFEVMGEGTTLTLQMNTGTGLKFTFQSRVSIDRSSTGYFRQSSPGLILVLIGERDSSGALTERRLLVTALYSAEQEQITGLLVPTQPTATPTVTATPYQRVEAQLISVTTAQGWITVHLSLFNARNTTLTLDEHSIWIAYGYAARPTGPQRPAQMPVSVVLPGQAAELTLTFAWAGEPYATVEVLDSYRFALTLTTEGG